MRSINLVNKKAKSWFSYELIKAKNNKLLLFMFSLGLFYYIIFHYIPMIGISIAFRNYKAGQSFFGGNWVGFKHFIDFFNDPYFFQLLRNTMLINVYALVFGFPMPIIFALLLNEIGKKLFKKFVQTISYLPHFISTVIISGMVINFLSSQTGIVNKILVILFDIDPIPFMTRSQYFRGIYTITNIWKSIGWNSIIYIAAIAGVDVSLYDAAKVDGVGRFGKMWHITLPSIKPTIIVLLILAIGHMMSVGAESIILIYNPTIYETADVISTYIYRRGLGVDGSPNYSFATAVGLFNSVVNFSLLYITNWICRKYSDSSLW